MIGRVRILSLQDSAASMEIHSFVPDSTLFTTRNRRHPVLLNRMPNVPTFRCLSYRSAALLSVERRNVLAVCVSTTNCSPASLPPVRLLSSSADILTEVGAVIGTFSEMELAFGYPSIEKIIEGCEISVFGLHHSVSVIT